MLHWIHLHPNTQAALSIQQPQRSSLPFTSHPWAQHRDVKTHRPVRVGLQTGAPTKLFLAIALSSAQELPWAPSGCCEAEPVPGIPTKPLARTHCPLVTWLSQPHSTHCQASHQGQNESMPPSYSTHPQNTLPLLQKRHLYFHHHCDFRQDAQPLYSSAAQLRDKVGEGPLGFQRKDYWCGWIHYIKAVSFFFTWSFINTKAFHKSRFTHN